MIKALVLDFDGLILDTETPFRESWQEIYAEHGLTVSPPIRPRRTSFWNGTSPGASIEKRSTPEG